MHKKKPHIEKSHIYVILGILVLLILTAVVSIHHFTRTKELVFGEHTDERLLVVDGVELTAGDVALYVAFQELKVEEQARTYDYDNTYAYWNLHINGKFVKLAAGEDAIQMAVHDEIFYQLALEEKLTLDETEQKALEEKQRDFWADLTEEQQEKLGISQDKLYQEIEKTALAEKYQNVIAKENNSDFDAYSIGGRPYKNILSEHEYQLDERMWSRFDFGNIILTH